MLPAAPAGAQTGGPLAGLACAAPDQRTGAQSVAVGALVSVQGRVRVHRAGLQRIDAGVADGLICPGDRIEVGERSRAALLLFGADTVLRLDQNTTLQIPAQPVPEEGVLALIRGALYFLSRTPRRLTVQTPFVNAGIDGTEFLIRYDEARRLALVAVFEGAVHARSAREDARLTAGQAVAVGADGAMRLVVTPPDAVQWTIRYDPLFAYLAGPRGAEAEAPLPPAVRPSYRAYRQGDPAAALRLLDAVPPAERDARYHVYRAALLLAIGPESAAEAEEAVAQALAAAPESPEAHAAGAVIAVAVNDKEEALARAERAVRFGPRSTAAHLARSYALQAQFRLEDALRSAAAAAESSDDPLLWSRVAELQIALGQPSAAARAAERALALAPELPQSWIGEGQAALARLDMPEARRAFAAALSLDPSDPAAHLGLGLAKIRQGELEDGRRDIEIAAILDPADPVIRSYLGKAYAEENRNAVAASELAMAKQLDPADPTPWYYSALLKQAENRPGEALADLQRSVALNENRAVYRGRRLIEQDRAVRGADIARIHQDLGFEQAAVAEATQALTYDPASHAAHELLARSYLDRPRRDIARASEELQSLLLRPTSGRPVEPALSQANLHLLRSPGPDKIGFAEWTRLFDREGANFLGEIFGGTDDTFGDEAILSGLFGRMGFSVGQFHYETDGFRPNNDIRHDFYNAFLQTSLTPDITLQFEARRRETEHGDVELGFDLDRFSPRDRRKLEQDTVRAGMRMDLAPGQTLLASGIYSERKVKLLDEVAGPLTVFSDDRSKQDAWDAQAQYLGSWDRLSLVAGVGITRADLDGLIIATFPDLPFIPPERTPRALDLWQDHAYAYLNVHLPADMIWTFGFGATGFDDDIVEIERLSPKLGVQWTPFDWLRLRATYFDVVKRELIVDQTLEPTQVAGFNQLFDDPNGTRAKAWGIGFDVQASGRLFAGAEYLHRDLKVPVGGIFRDQDENSVEAYTYWVPLDRFALRLEPGYEEVESADLVPDRVETFKLPLGFRYFHPLGFYLGATATYVRQRVDFTNLAGGGREREAFVVVDASAGYRFPNRRGLIAIEINNLFDEDFRYQDLNFLASEPNAIPEFYPDRRVVGRLRLQF